MLESSFKCLGRSNQWPVFKELDSLLWKTKEREGLSASTRPWGPGRRSSLLDVYPLYRRACPPLSSPMSYSLRLVTPGYEWLSETRPRMFRRRYPGARA
jgi:hypothetical protein